MPAKRKAPAAGIDYDALWKRSRAGNQLRPKPRLECPSCNFPTMDGDWGEIRSELCCVCESAWLGGIIARAGERLGREELIEALTRLADGG